MRGVNITRCKSQTGWEDLIGSFRLFKIFILMRTKTRSTSRHFFQCLLFSCRHILFYSLSSSFSSLPARTPPKMSEPFPAPPEDGESSTASRFCETSGDDAPPTFQFIDETRTINHVFDSEKHTTQKHTTEVFQLLFCGYWVVS